MTRLRSLIRKRNYSLCPEFRISSLIQRLMIFYRGTWILRCGSFPPCLTAWQCPGRRTTSRAEYPNLGFFGDDCIYKPLPVEGMGDFLDPAAFSGLKEGDHFSFSGSEAGSKRIRLKGDGINSKRVSISKD